VHQRNLKQFLIDIAEEGLSASTAAALGDREKVTERLRSIDPAIVNLPAVVNSVHGMLREAVRQGTAK